MNRMVPNNNVSLDDWYKAINSMFGDVVQCNCGGFDADVDMIPPFVTHMPPNHLSECFIFNEIKTGTCSRYDHAQITLMELIEESINNDITGLRDTSRATIVWRVKPEIMNQEDRWRGYARLKVLDKHSQLKRYG